MCGFWNIRLSSVFRSWSLNWVQFPKFWLYYTVFKSKCLILKCSYKTPTTKLQRSDKHKFKKMHQRRNVVCCEHFSYIKKCDIFKTATERITLNHLLWDLLFKLWIGLGAHVKTKNSRWRTDKTLSALLVCRALP